MALKMERKFLTLCTILAISMPVVVSMHLIVSRSESDDFLTEFTPKIYAIEQGFNELIHFTKSDVGSNFNPFDPVEICVVNEVKLVEMYIIIEETKGEYDSLTTVVKKATCPEFNELKIGILKLKLHFMNMLKKRTNSLAYDDLKIKYEGNYKALHEEMDEALNKSSAKDKKIIYEMRIELQAQYNRVIELLRELEEKQEIIDSKSVQLCILELKRNNVQKALDSYRNVSDTKKMKDIIHSSYENAESFQKLLEFIEAASDSVSSLYGFATLFIEMESANHMDPKNVYRLGISVCKNLKDFLNLSSSKECEILLIINSLIDYFIKNQRD